MNDTEDQFETRLLAALREHVADRTPMDPEIETSDETSARRGRRTTRLVLGGIAASVVAAVGLVVVPGLGVTPAYSVQEGNAGTIEVKVNRLEDAEGLEKELAEYGVNADITYVADGGECAPDRYVSVQRRLGIRLEIGQERFKVTLDPGTVRDGETLVIDVSGVPVPDSVDPETGNQLTDGFRSWVSAEVANGPVPACTPIPPSG